MQKAYIIDGLRSPIGNFKGTLSQIRTDDLLAQVLQALVAKYPNIPDDAYSDVIIGCANQAGEDNRNVARMSLLLAGLPVTVPGVTINRLCASGLNAVADAARAIKCSEGDVFLAGGVEGMSRSPYVLSKAESGFATDQKMYDSSFGWRFINPKMQEAYGTEAMGQTAENLADLFQISREEQDQFALMTQQKAARAQAEGVLAEEILPIQIPQRKGDPVLFDKDEFIKPNSDLTTLAKLKPAFRKEGGTVTAGNASGLNDGAAALLLASENAVKKYGLNPLAEVLSSAATGTEPRIMGIGPVEASKLALQRAGLELSQMDVIELNEAFAAQSIAVLRGLGLENDDPRVNPNGGAIALGHPLGMSGARIALSAAKELQRKNLRYALVTMCIGVGQGYAVILENPNFKEV